MDSKRKIALFSPLVLIPTMFLIYRALAAVFGETLGWYLGFFPYWILWCGLFPLWLLGRDKLRRLIAPQRLTRLVLLLLAVPILGAAAYRLVPGMDYGQGSFWLVLMILSTSFGNGFFEEVYWRGVYLALFPKSVLHQIVWPSIWFALWHYAPGSVSADGSVVGLMIGSGFFGLYLAFLARRTGAIWWSIVAHTVGGLIMAL